MMENLLRFIAEEPQEDALLQLATQADVLDNEITVDCSTLTNHCVCATNFEYLYKPDHLMHCLEKGKCFHCQRYKCMNKDHDTVTAMSKLILVAAALGKFEVLKYLHQHGCSLESKTGIFELRPLHLSIVHGHFNIFCYLMTQKVDVNAVILSHGTTYSPLMLAVINKRYDMVRYLLMAKDINVAYRNSLLQSPVMFAVQNNSLHLVNLLLMAEDRRTRNRKTPSSRHRERMHRRSQHPGALLEALKQDNAKVLNVLIESGCSADYVFKGYHVQISALVLATIRNSVKCLEILLQSGAEDNLLRDGYNAFAWAKFLGWDECLAVLQNAVSVTRTSESKPDGLKCSEVQFKPNDLLSEPTEADNDPDADNRTGTCYIDGDLQTKTLTVSYQYSVPPVISVWGLVQWMDISDTLRRLIAQGHDVNIRDQYGRTSLHLAVEEQSRAGLRTLLQLGANPDLRDSCDATPFWHAVYWNKRSMIQELIFANVTMETKARKDAFKLGVPWQNVIIPSANSRAHYRSPLYVAVKKGWKMTVHMLLEAGYDTKGENIDDLLDLSKDEIKTALTDYISRPQSLMNLSRNLIRKHCQVKIHKLVEGLDVPTRIKDYLLLRDVVDLKIEPVLVHL